MLVNNFDTICGFIAHIKYDLKFNRSNKIDKNKNNKKKNSQLWKMNGELDDKVGSNGFSRWQSVIKKYYIVYLIDYIKNASMQKFIKKKTIIYWKKSSPIFLLKTIKTDILSV